MCRKRNRNKYKKTLYKSRLFVFVFLLHFFEKINSVLSFYLKTRHLYIEKIKMEYLIYS